jgi:acyl-CoA thioester hydrolase
MNRNDFIFKIEDYKSYADLRIRFNDIDILGHLNNVVYFSLFDTAKADYLTAVKKGNVDWRRVESVIANVNCSFISSAFYGEPIRIYTRCIAMGEKSYTLQQVMTNTNTKEVKAVCDTVMVSFDPETKKSVAISNEHRKAIEDFEGVTF